MVLTQLPIVGTSFAKLKTSRKGLYWILRSKSAFKLIKIVISLKIVISAYSKAQHIDTSYKEHSVQYAGFLQHLSHLA